MVSRHCPACKTALPPGSGVKFDEKHNVLCAFCGKIVFIADPAKEAPDKPVAPAVQTPLWPGYHQRQHHAAGKIRGFGGGVVPGYDPTGVGAACYEGYDCE